MAYGLTHRDPANDLAHGPGKRWDGTRYTCSECRDFWHGMDRIMAAVTETFVSLADALGQSAFAVQEFGAAAAPALLSLGALPLTGAFPPPRFPLPRDQQVRRHPDPPAALSEDPVNRIEHDSLHRERDSGGAGCLFIPLLLLAIWIGIFAGLTEYNAIDCRLFALEKHVETRMPRRDSPQDWLSPWTCMVHTLDGEVPLYEFRRR